MKKVTFNIRFGKIKGLCWGKGNKKKILALHGWLDNAASFTQLAPLLAKDGYEVIAIDFSGHGKSDHKAEGHFNYFIDYVFEIQSVLDILKWDKPILLGHSMGAGMAQMYSATNPEGIDKLIMIENLGAVPAYEKGTAASNLKEALLQWKNHSTKHKRYYKDKNTALHARIKATPMPDDILYPMVSRGLKKTKKGYRWRTDKRLRLRSPVRMSEQFVEDVLSSQKPITQVIIAEPITYALSYPTMKQRLKTLEANQVDYVKGSHHVHMDNVKEVYEAISGFLNKED